MKWVIFVGLLLISQYSHWAIAAQSDNIKSPNQVQPYIDSLKEKYDLRPTPEPPAPAPIQAQPLKPSLDNPQDVQPFIEELRTKEGLPPPPESKANGEVQPYIESLKHGRELEAVMRPKVHQAFGFSFVASNTFNIKSSKVQANTFEQVYNPNDKYSPSVDVFYEYQLWRNHYTGSLGLVGHLGMIYNKGRGIFTKTGAPSSDTEFKFYSMPVSIGGSYRFVQGRFVVPFIQLMATAIPILETRNDDHPSRKGISRAYNVTGGVALSLDWISRRDAWAQYDAQGILHTYLVGQLEFLRTITGPIAYNYNGTYLGLAFEF